MDIRSRRNRPDWRQLHTRPGVAGTRAAARAPSNLMTRRNQADNRLSGPSREADPILASEDGSIEFEIKARGSRVVLTQTRRQLTGTEVRFSNFIADERAFADWSAVEPTRFDHPLLFEKVCRRLRELFSPPG